ncbi:MAG: hypothetical protein ACR2PA_11065 [Hyphomicrobiaceae bacterium]
MRHALGVLGVLAAGVLLLVSAAMNWRFGYQLGTTEFDGFIYGSASAAADCLKALVPFFIFAAVRNKMWAQALASVLVWGVVTVYSLTSALGHAALNRQDTAGTRASEVQTYKDLRADLERAKSQLGWVPQHRPASTVQSEIDGLKLKRQWKWTKGCTTAKGRSNRRFCDNFTGLKAELASANEAAKLEVRIASTQAKLEGQNGVTHSSADPQAAVLANLAGIFMPGVKMEHIQTALVIFIALLLEVGSGLGMYIAFSQWRLKEVRVPVAIRKPEAAAYPTETPNVVATEPVAAAVTEPQIGANDNKSVPQLTAPETDVERYYNENVESQDGSSLTATALYEDYCAWCDEQEKEPLALPTFGREFGDLGVQKAKIAGRVRYIGIALRTGTGSTEDKNAPVPIVRAA